MSCSLSTHVKGLCFQVLEMSPIEVAIDEMESRVKELREIINKKPTDVKKLQLKLQVCANILGSLVYMNLLYISLSIFLASWNGKVSCTSIK